MKLLFLLLFLSLSGKDPSDNGISYRSLTWADFRGKCPADEPGTAAKTSTEIELTTTQNGIAYTWAVTCHFLPYSSFVRVRTPEVLRHEQTHFKIAYIASLKFECRVWCLQGGDSVANIIAQGNYAKYLSWRDEQDSRFDAETNHSLKVTEEKAWEAKIDQELTEVLKIKKSQLARIHQDTKVSRSVRP
jgi:hypothetical protein